ncbi:unnamed protein product [Cylicostephanus goldi]|uniref:Uncharacterized protein n=1 Tax=Cylicostephanus goldi TaxID=71465 RepID=A0A3P6S2Y7_CYLGO|nr:unnamed protein product [Cylicostephanus goldi]
METLRLRKEALNYWHRRLMLRSRTQTLLTN